MILSLEIFLKSYKYLILKATLWQTKKMRLRIFIMIDFYFVFQCFIFFTLDNLMNLIDNEIILLKYSGIAAHTITR